MRLVRGRLRRAARTILLALMDIPVLKYVVYYGTVALVILILGDVGYFIQKKICNPKRAALRQLKAGKSVRPARTANTHGTSIFPPAHTAGSSTPIPDIHNSNINVLCIIPGTTGTTEYSSAPMSNSTPCGLASPSMSYSGRAGKATASPVPTSMQGEPDVR